MSCADTHGMWDDTTRAGVERPPTTRTLTVTEVTFRRGEGCCDTEVMRQCRAYYDESGELLAIDDPLEVELAKRRVARGVA